MSLAERTHDVDYNSAIRTFMSSHFPKKTLEPDAEELLKKLLNAVNRALVEEFHAVRKTGSLPDKKYLQASQKAVENYLEGAVQRPVRLETSEEIRRSSGKRVVTESGHLLCSGCVRVITSCPICRDHVRQHPLRRAYL